MASDLVDVIWQGPFDGERADGTFLRRGDRLQVTTEEAQSAHYELVKTPRKTKSDSGHDGGDN